VRPGFCLNVDAKVRASGGDDYRVTVADLKAFEQANGPIPEGAVMVIATGWDRYWTDAVRYRNERDGVKHFPGLSGEAAAYLANERRVAGIVIDTLSVDYGPSTTFDVHRTTHPRNIYHVENAARLTTLPPRGFTVVVAPINVAGASGGATRVYALIP
jgi:kynurenine formamidase